MLAFYFVAIRGMEVAGGPTYRLWPLLIKTASYTLGGPGSGAAAGIIALLAVAALCVALIYLMVERDDRWIFYAVVIVAPLALIAIQRPEQLYVRYFMISVAASLLLLAAGYSAAIASRRCRNWFSSDVADDLRDRKCRAYDYPTSIRSRPIPRRTPFYRNTLC